MPSSLCFEKYTRRGLCNRQEHSITAFVPVHSAISLCLSVILSFNPSFVSIHPFIYISSFLLAAPCAWEILVPWPGIQSWVFIGRTDGEAETPILWPPDVKNWLVEKDSDAGKDWGKEEKGMTEDEMVGWHHRLNGHGFEQALGAGDGQGSLVCCSPWHGKSWTWLKEWTEPNQYFLYFLKLFGT